jgi:hypothetical protein
MKIEINNLTALIQGRDLNLYQRSLAVEEWHKLLNHVKEMEQALSIADIVEQNEYIHSKRKIRIPACFSLGCSCYKRKILQVYMVEKFLHYSEK